MTTEPQMTKTEFIWRIRRQMESYEDISIYHYCLLAECQKREMEREDQDYEQAVKREIWKSVKDVSTKGDVIQMLIAGAIPYVSIDYRRPDMTTKPIKLANEDKGRPQMTSEAFIHACRKERALEDELQHKPNSYMSLLLAEAERRERHRERLKTKHIYGAESL